MCPNPPGYLGAQSGFAGSDDSQSLLWHLDDQELVLGIGHDGYVEDRLTVDLDVAADLYTDEARDPIDQRHSSGDVGIGVQPCSFCEDGPLYEIAVDQVVLVGEDR